MAVQTTTQSINMLHQKYITKQMCMLRIMQSLMHCHFATICSRITRFSPKCAEIKLVTRRMDKFWISLSWLWWNILSLAAG